RQLLPERLCRSSPSNRARRRFWQIAAFLFGDLSHGEQACRHLSAPNWVPAARAPRILDLQFYRDNPQRREADFAQFAACAGGAQLAPTTGCTLSASGIR